MKSAAKAFIWIAMILSFYLIFPVIVGVCALKKLDSATTKEELTNIGILTLIFCSMIGGIFMLCIDDNELAQNASAGSIRYEKVIVDNAKNNTKLFAVAHLVILISLVVVSLLMFVFACLGWFSDFCPTVSMSLTFAFVIASFVLTLIIGVIYYENKFKNNKWTIILTGLFLALVVCIIIFSIFAAKGHWAFWVVFGLACYLVPAALLELILVLVEKIKLKPQKVIKQKVVVSKLEQELTEAKRLYDNGVITEEEYKKMREVIISKHC